MSVLYLRIGQRERLRVATEKFNWHGLDLTSALRLLKQAGRGNPLSLHLEPHVQLQVLIDSLCDLSMHDGLTGLVNRTFFEATLASELDRSARTRRTCGLLVMDLDHFKEVNDEHGHAAGDQVLVSVALQLRRSLRSMDTAARAGGDEFAVILPECSPEDAVRAAGRIHSQINALVVPCDGPEVCVSASAGLVWTEPGLVDTPKTILRRADAQLYQAKRAGRGRLSIPELRPTRVSVLEHQMLLMPEIEEDLHAK